MYKEAGIRDTVRTYVGHVTGANVKDKEQWIANSGKYTGRVSSKLDNIIKSTVENAKETLPEANYKKGLAQGATVAGITGLGAGLGVKYIYDKNTKNKKEKVAHYKEAIMYKEAGIGEAFKSYKGNVSGKTLKAHRQALDSMNAAYPTADTTEAINNLYAAASQATKGVHKNTRLAQGLTGAGVAGAAAGAGLGAKYLYDKKKKDAEKVAYYTENFMNKEAGAKDAFNAYKGNVSGKTLKAHRAALDSMNAAYPDAVSATDEVKHLYGLAHKATKGVAKNTRMAQGLTGAAVLGAGAAAGAGAYAYNKKKKSREEKVADYKDAIMEKCAEEFYS